MPLRTINFTGRKQLAPSDVRITLRQEGTASAFDADIELDTYALPEDAFVFVEAYRLTRYMRFNFGRVGSMKPPKNRWLTQFETPEGLLFRVKVVSESDPAGLLLAEADNIRAVTGDTEARRVPLLPVVSSSELGQEIFRLEFDASQVLLLINESVGDWRSLVRDPIFAGLVYPAAFRAILTRILYVERHYDSAGDGDWRCSWLRFASDLPGVGELPGENSEADFDEWIEEAVATFSGKSNVLGEFQRAWESLAST